MKGDGPRERLPGSDRLVQTLIFFSLPSFPSVHSASILSSIFLLLTQDYTDGAGVKMELGIFVLRRSNGN